MTCTIDSLTTRKSADYVGGNRMKQQLVRVSKLVLGIGCLILGVIGLFLPFLQGILFVVIGLSLLSSESERARRLLEWVKERVPGLAHREGDSDI